ncbi:MAG: hypothetical protein ABSA96_08965 [Candidatus Acidiferrales bacterium]
MLRLASMIATAALLLSGDVPGVIRTRPPIDPVDFLHDQNLPVLPDLSQANSSQGSGQAQPAQDDPLAGNGLPKTKDEAKEQPLQPESRLALVRFVDGEFARVVAPLPAGKNGIHIKARVHLDEQQLRVAVGASGAALNPGDKAQITNLTFKDRQIVVDVNGGGRGKRHIRDHIHMEMGGPTMTTSEPQPTVNTAVGATIFLDFDKPLPDMSPDDLKQYLSGVLDFSKQHSAAIQWIETLPPDIQKAITEKQPAVGMDREMVIAAIGRPDRKVREKTEDGGEIEDWIYGKPPAKTVFVRFEGDKVTGVKQYPQ